MKHLILLVALTITAGCTTPTKPIAIIPTPQTIQEYGSTYTLPNEVTINIAASILEPIAELISTTLDVTTVKQDKDADITVTLDTTLLAGSYELEIRDNINIKAGNYEGASSAVSTLYQLKGIDNNDIHSVSITDAPRFSWRGLMLDVSRHFHSKEDVKHVLDLMHQYKLNRFHWHLTDDQGWRIEIKKYPLLTEKGAWRSFNFHDRECMSLSSKNNNSDFNIPEENLRINGTDTLYGGFYTQEDIKDIVQYASTRGIEVIPEIDMPGHFFAAVENYPFAACKGALGWGEMFSSPICVGSDEAMEFAKNIYAEVFELFPNEYVHLGADEVEKTNWKKCRDCQKRIKKEGLKDEHELQSWFVHQMEDFFNANSKQLIGWDEILEGGLSDNSTIMWWRSWAEDAVYRATEQGNKAIMTPNVFSYFDYAQDKNTIKKIYDYNPADSSFTPEQQALIQGFQANVWCEYIPTMDRFEYMVMPRLLALSEVAWNTPQNKNWDKFQSNLQHHLTRLDATGVNYKIPDIEGFNKSNVFIDSDTLTITLLDPNASIRYTDDGSEPTLSSAEYIEPIIISESTDFTFATFRSNGTKSDVTSTSFIKENYSPASSIIPDKSGLKATWHNYRGSKCLEIEQAPINDVTVIEDVVIPSHAKDNIGLNITGYINIPKDGIYTFSLLSDDGSILYLDGQEVVNNDGNHSPREVIGEKALSKGWHSIKVLYFDHNGGILSLKMNGKAVPISSFKH